MTSPKRDPAARNRPGAQRVPMHPWSDPRHNTKPVTREELIAILGQVDLTIAKTVAAAQFHLQAQVDALALPWHRRVRAWFTREKRETPA